MAVPAALLLVRCCEAAQLLLLMLSWTVAAPDVICALQRLRARSQPLTRLLSSLRRVRIWAAAALLAWVFSPIPWQTFVASALMVVLLDALFVLTRCSPVRTAPARLCSCVSPSAPRSCGNASTR